MRKKGSLENLKPPKPESRWSPTGRRRSYPESTEFVQASAAPESMVAVWSCDPGLTSPWSSSSRRVEARDAGGEACSTATPGYQQSGGRCRHCRAASRQPRCSLCPLLSQSSSAQTGQTPRSWWRPGTPSTSTTTATTTLLGSTSSLCDDQLLLYTDMNT